MLLIDAGNSRLKCWLVETGQVPKEEVFSSADYIAEMGDWLSGQANTSRILVSSVLDRQFELWLAQICSGLDLPEPEFIETPVRGMGIQVAYEDPGQLGVDRYLAMAEGYRQVAGAVIVVDCGTAVTIDAVDLHGVHMGGVIMPGVDLMKKALGAETHGVRDLDDHGVDVFANVTAQGVSTGCLLAVVGGIRDVLERQCDRMEDEPQYLLTGGQAECIAESLGLPVRVCHNLVLDALLTLANRQ